MPKNLQEQVRELNRKLKHLKKENSFLVNALNVLEEGIHIVDAQGNTVFYSKGLEKIEKSSSKQIIGKHISEAYKLDDESSILLKVLKTGIAVKNHETTYALSNGKTISIITDTYPIYSHGTVIAAISVNRDNSDRRAMTETIFRLQKQLYSQQENPLKNGTQYTFDHIVGESEVLMETIELAKATAVNNSPVLIQGETGTGKELFAQSIHNYSPRANGPFVAVNCAAIPETLLESILFGTAKGAFTGAENKKGLFEEASNGTLFLDELSSMSMLLQTKLLRVLETKTVRRVGGEKEIPVNPRIISAVNIDPLEAIAKDQLRRDLYYRLAVVSIPIPPLRKRKSDIPVLVRYFIKRSARIMGKSVRDVTPEVQQVLQKHNWPGNVRELQHAIEYALNVIDSDSEHIDLQHLQPNLTKLTAKTLPDYNTMSGKDLKSLLLSIEHDIIKSKLEENNNNISQTAKALGISRQHLQYRMKKLFE